MMLELSQEGASGAGRDLLTRLRDLCRNHQQVRFDSVRVQYGIVRKALKKSCAHLTTEGRGDYFQAIVTNLRNIR
jgi:hypothetical protein